MSERDRPPPKEPILIGREHVTQLPDDYTEALVSKRGSRPDDYWERIIDAYRFRWGGNWRFDPVKTWIGKMSTDGRKAMKQKLDRGHFEVIEAEYSPDSRRHGRYNRAWQKASKEHLRIYLNADSRGDRARGYTLTAPDGAHTPDCNDWKCRLTADELRRVLMIECGSPERLEMLFHEHMQRRIDHCGAIHCPVCDRYRTDKCWKRDTRAA